MAGPQKPNFAGFVLAGGRSSRMGRDKALLDFGGEPLLVRTASLAREAAGSVTVIGPPERYAGLGFEVVADAKPGLGPLGGIVTALTITRAPWNLILACDLPGIDLPFLQSLLELACPSQAKVLIPRGARPEPLCAVYSSACRRHLQSSLDRGILKITDAIEGLPVRWLPVGNRHKLVNLNTPKDLEAFLG